MLDSVTRRLEELEQRHSGVALEVPANATPLDFLQAIYRSPSQPLERRMRAAIEALPFVHPKLAVTALVDGGDAFAAALERAIKRSGKLIKGYAGAEARAVRSDLAVAISDNSSGHFGNIDGDSNARASGTDSKRHATDICSSVHDSSMLE
jgi:hypothetical protein